MDALWPLISGELNGQDVCESTCAYGNIICMRPTDSPGPGAPVTPIDDADDSMAARNLGRLLSVGRSLLLPGHCRWPFQLIQLAVLMMDYWMVARAVVVIDGHHFVGCNDNVPSNRLPCGSSPFFLRIQCDFQNCNKTRERDWRARVPVINDWLYRWVGLQCERMNEH